VYIIEGKVREKKEEEVERILELEGSLMVQPEQVMKWGHVEREARGGGMGRIERELKGGGGRAASIGKRTSLRREWGIE